MKKLAAAICIATLVALRSYGYGSAASEGEVLFNGNDLSGWTQQNDGTFAATNGVIEVSGGKGWLRTDKEYSDFVLEVEWRGMETNYNSGIFVRTPLEGKPWPTNSWQINLKQTGVGELIQGSKKILLSKHVPVPVGEWVTFRIEAHGKKLTLAINGEPAWEFNELEPAIGYIGIQAEGKMVEVRNFRVLTSGS